MIQDKLIDRIRILLNENDISEETSISIIKLLVAEQFKHFDVINDFYAKVLNDIKTILENDSLDDFQCVEKIVVVFESLDIGVNYRHDFG